MQTRLLVSGPSSHCQTNAFQKQTSPTWIKSHLTNCFLRFIIFFYVLRNSCRPMLASCFHLNIAWVLTFIYDYDQFELLQCVMWGKGPCFCVSACSCPNAFVERTVFYPLRKAGCALWKSQETICMGLRLCRELVGWPRRFPCLCDWSRFMRQ